MEDITILTRSDRETKKLGAMLAKEILKSSFVKTSEDKLKTATVLSLEGELGSGKTTFTQGFAKGLGSKENPRSPTFVIMQIYPVRSHGRLRLRPTSNGVYTNFIHVDAYRLKSMDFTALNWKDFIKNKRNIILIEWGNKIKNILPKNSLRILFKHFGPPHQRLIKVCK